MAERRAIVVTGSNHFGEMPAGDVFPASSYAAAIAALHPLTPAADRLPYYTSGSAAALATFTAFGRSLIAANDASAARTALGLGTMATEAAANYVTVATTQTVTGSKTFNSSDTFPLAVIGSGGTTLLSMGNPSNVPTINAYTAVFASAKLQLQSHGDLTEAGGALTINGALRLNQTSANASNRNFAIGQLTSFGTVDFKVGASNGSDATVGPTVFSYNSAGVAVTGTLSCTQGAVLASSAGSVLCGSAADSAGVIIAKGGGKAVRLGGNSTRATIEGVDETGFGSFQPLYIGGSALSLGIAGATTVSVTASGAEVTGLLDTRPTSGLMFRAMETGSGSSRRIQFSNSGNVNTIESTTGAGSTVFAFAQDSVERMRFATSGNLLIGTMTDNGQLLQLSAADSGVSALRVTNTTNTVSVRLASSIGVTDAAVLYTEGAHALRLGTNNAERMRITSGGRVLIATTTDLGASYQLQVNGGGSFSGLLDVSLFRFGGYGTIASSTESAVGGELSYDGSYLYVATGTNTWMRAALSTF